MAKVIAKVISDDECAFVSDKQIVDNIFKLNESIYFSKRQKKQDLMLKIDFEKAIWGCLSSAIMAVLVNGIPSGSWFTKIGHALSFRTALRKRFSLLKPLSRRIWRKICLWLDYELSKVTNECTAISKIEHFPSDLATRKILELHKYLLKRRYKMKRRLRSQ